MKLSVERKQQPVSGGGTLFILSFKLELRQEERDLLLAYKKERQRLGQSERWGGETIETFQRGHGLIDKRNVTFETLDPEAALKVERAVVGDCEMLKKYIHIARTFGGSVD
jgi:hypothetical protein